MKIPSFLRFVLCAVGTGAIAPSMLGAPAVPSNQAALYAQLDRALTAVESQLAGAPAVSPKPDGTSPVFGAELLAASSNLGERLFEPRRLDSVRLSLRRLREMGFRGVGVCVQYPIFLPEFPRHDEYIAFYREVGRAIHAEGLQCWVELNVFFNDRAFGPVQWSYQGITLEKFATGLNTMNRILLTEMQPDYLFCIDEPDTILANLGLKGAHHEADLLAVIRTAFAGLKDVKGHTRFGSGAGTWTDPNYFEPLALMPELDLLNLHIYPVGGDLLTGRIDALDALAKKHGKQLCVGESWLYKAGHGEMNQGVASAAKLFARDVYSYWEPLDARFFKILAEQARRHDFAFCSFFWMRYFYAQLDASPELDRLSPGQLFQRANQAAGQNLLKGQLSPLGQAVKALVATPGPQTH